MGTEVLYRHICDVCNTHIKDETYRASVTPWGPAAIPPPQYQNVMGGRVLCGRCYDVLNNVAMAIAPGVMAQSAQTVAPARSSSPESPSVAAPSVRE